ncbi:MULTISPECIES: GNAT family N-acetyltransferase [unclassified Kitasatospora]|uniref:GNAT family N-acetyltransferase n=1 Tax=unclassified Kitasatospora TaxID=2633591 RepID=UPI0037FFB930
MTPPSWLVPHWPLTLTTPRLTLRPLAAPDLPALAELCRDPEVRRHLGGPVPEERIAVRLAAAEGAPGAFAVTARTDGPRPEAGPLLGLVSLDADHRAAGRTELSYQFLPRHQGRGQAREAVAEAVRWAVATAPAGWPVVAVTQAANTRSRSLLEHLGLRPAERLTEYGEPQVLYILPAPGDS